MQENLSNIKKESSDLRYITYQNMFWIFMIGNLVGFVLEGFFCLFKYGQWESHVVTVWGPFCLIYGIGFVFLYISAVFFRSQNIIIKFIAIGLILSTVELLCGLVLEFGMGMRAWNYSKHFLNLRGHISLRMIAVWGALGVVFAYFAVRPFQRLFKRIKGKKALSIACAVLSVFMAVNLSVTLVCMIRWKQRHDGIAHKTRIGQFIDKHYDDEKMSSRFVEWRFLNVEQEGNEDGNDSD